MAAGGMNASPTSPNTSGYSGPAPAGGGTSPSPSFIANDIASKGGIGRLASGKQAGNPMPPPSGSLDAYAQPYSGPVGGGTPPSMTPTPPTNPLPAPPQPQMQPAVMPPYGGPQRGPGSSFGGDMDSFGPRGGYGNLPPDRMPRRDMFDRGPFGRREQQPGGPTWSQQGGVFNYNPNGQQQRGGFNPFGNAPAMPNAVPGQFRQMMQDRMQDRMQQMRAQPPGYGGLNPANLPAGLGAINPYNQAAAQRGLAQQYNPQMAGKPLTLEELKQAGAQVDLAPSSFPQTSMSPEELARVRQQFLQSQPPSLAELFKIT